MCRTGKWPIRFCLIKSDKTPFIFAKRSNIKKTLIGLTHQTHNTFLVQKNSQNTCVSFLFTWQNRLQLCQSTSPIRLGIFKAFHINWYDKVKPISVWFDITMQKKLDRARLVNKKLIVWIKYELTNGHYVKLPWLG